ncbi:polymorphic transmembrane cluster 2 transmembrane protein 2 [Biomphalaria pfeifferi]|uniref:Polymorphic transmembrane cluster 2 transmembrane protein 2 n=1 Tax=Biomphalaria pfeifferi TaxID=112525 RepID=A0AAD8C624_BIOPF|nr:polymorphic transmembrane cluster 2 transmembrane protein 2 [Biomphalaria pfeifferi]
MLFTFLVYLFLQIIYSSALKDCEPAEEGKDHQLTLNWTAQDLDNKELRVKRGDGTPGKCDSLTKNCSSFFRDKFTISRSRFSVDVMIHKVERSDAKIWRISYSETPIAECKLSTYIKPENVRCYQEENKSEINVTCTTSKVYPAAKCSFHIYINGEKSYNSNAFVSYEDSNFIEQEQFFMSNCTFQIPKFQLKTGYYKINATLSPGLAVDQHIFREETKYGSSSTIINFQIDSPLIKLQNCPQLVHENTQYTCQCTSVNRSESYLIRWYDKQRNLLHEGESLTFIANRSLPEYLCEGTDNHQSKTPWLLYKPVLLGKEKNISCTLHNVNDVRLICSTNGICLQALCIFNVSYSNGATGMKSSLYLSHDFEEHQVCSTCILALNKSDFDSNTDCIHVALYLNMADNHEQMLYVDSTLVQLRKEIHTKDEGTRLSIIISASAAAAVTLLILTALCIANRKKRRKRKQQKQEEEDAIKTGTVKHYDETYSFGSGHIYESVKEEDHYDNCEDTRYETRYETSLARDEKRQDPNLQYLLDTEYITPIEVEQILNSISILKMQNSSTQKNLVNDMVERSEQLVYSNHMETV